MLFKHPSEHYAGTQPCILLCPVLLGKDMIVVIELREARSQLISILADNVRSSLLERKCVSLSAECDFQKQITLTVGEYTLCLGYALLIGLFEDRIHPCNSVQQERACLSVCRHKLVKVKDIVLCPVVYKITELDGCNCYSACNISLVLVSTEFRVLDPLHSRLIHCIKQERKSHNSAVTGLVGLAVSTVHSTEAEVLRLGLTQYPCLFGTAEHLRKVQALSLVNNVPDSLRSKVLLTLNYGSKVSSCINAGAVCLSDDYRRYSDLVIVPCDIDHHSTLALIHEALLFKRFHKLGNILVSIALAVPVVKAYVQAVIVFLYIGDRLPCYLTSEIQVSLLTLLHTHSKLFSSCLEVLVLLALCTCTGIDLIKLIGCEGQLSCLFGVKILLEALPLRVTHLKLSHNKTHLQAPVTKVNIGNSSSACSTNESFQSLTDNGSSEVPYMQGLSYIRSAVVKHYGFGLFSLRNSAVFVSVDLIYVGQQQLVRDINIDKACTCELSL